VRVRLGRRILDREIAEGAGLDDSPVRAARARQLSSLEERRAVAACLEHILDAADECAADPGSPLVVDHAAVISARAELVSVIERLRGDRDVDACAVARARLLAEDPRCRRLWSGRSLQHALSDIADAFQT